MIWIQKVFEPAHVRCDYVRCPACGHGRLCDKPAGEKAVVIAVNGGATARGNRIILKCPKCSQRFLIGISKE